MLRGRRRGSCRNWKQDLDSDFVSRRTLARTFVGGWKFEENEGEKGGK